MSKIGSAEYEGCGYESITQQEYKNMSLDPEVIIFNTTETTPNADGYFLIFFETGVDKFYVRLQAQQSKAHTLSLTSSIPRLKVNKGMMLVKRVMSNSVYEIIEYGPEIERIGSENYIICNGVTERDSFKLDKDWFVIISEKQITGFLLK